MRLPLFFAAIARWIGGIVVIFLPLLTQAQQGDPTAFGWQTQTLRNGLEARYIQDTTRQYLHLGMTLRGGASLSPENASGLAQLYEHLFFQYLPDTLPATAAQRKGVLVSHQTQVESQFFGLSLPQQEMELGLAMLAQGLLHDDWPIEQMQKAQGEIADELQAQESVPESYLEAELIETLWQDAASRKQIPGKYADILRLTSARIRTEMAPYLHPGNCRLNATGPSDGTAFFALSDSILGDWRPESAGAMLPQTIFPKLDSNIYFTLLNEFAAQPLIMIAWPLDPPCDQPHLKEIATTFCTLVMLKRSPMYRALVGGGLAHSFQFGFTGDLTPGQLVLYILPEQERFSECLQAVHQELGKFASSANVPKEIITLAADRIRLDAALLNDGSMSRLAEEGQDWLCDPEATAESIDDYEVKPKDIQTFVTRYLVRRPHVAGLLASSYVAYNLNADVTFQAPTNALVVVSVEDHTVDSVAATRVNIDPAVLRSMRVYFDATKGNPNAKAEEGIAEIGKMLRDNPDKRIFINSFAESQGDGVVNYQLSIARAKALRQKIVQQYLVPESQLVIRAYGEAFPEFPDDTPEHKAKNRRITFEFAPQDAQDNAF